MGSYDASSSPAVPIPSPTTLVCVRTSKLKPFGALSISSGIDKDPRNGRVYVSYSGLADDEHDLTFHGGPDKAIHQYCSDHYPFWQSLYPDSDIAARFTPGGFGENLVADGFNERNICIGDKVRIGFRDDLLIGGAGDVLLENFAPRTHELARTGWYYRVLKEGWIEKGMDMSVVERQWPRWTIERLHFFTHKDKQNQDAMEELMAVQQMGMECRGVFGTRLQKLKAKKEENGKRPVAEVFPDFKVVEKRQETSQVVALVLDAVDKVKEGDEVPEGSHVRVKFPNFVRAYSVVGGTTDHFELGIARDEKSRGGSAYIHDTLRVRDAISVGSMTESIEVASMASHHILIAGGIGITAFLRMVEVLDAVNFAYELHYSVRAADDVAFSSRLKDLGLECANRYL